MLHDPYVDKTHRKPRQVRNTRLGKYAHLISLGLTFLYTGGMYISYRINVLPHLNDEAYKKMYEEQRKNDIEYDFSAYTGFAKKLIWGETTDVEAKDMQTD